MGFTWTNLDGKEIIGSHQQEMIDNIISVESSLLLDGSVGNEKHIWTTNMNPFNKQYIGVGEASEVRSATDNLDDKNYCRAHRTVNYGTDDSSEYISYFTTRDNTVKNEYDVTDNVTHNISYDNGQNISYDSVDDGSFYNGRDNSYDSSEEGSYNNNNE